MGMMVCLAFGEDYHWRCCFMQSEGVLRLILADFLEPQGDADKVDDDRNLFLSWIFR